VVKRTAGRDFDVSGYFIVPLPLTTALCPMTSSSLKVTPWAESGGTCACCGRQSKTIWGDVSQNESTVAAYYVQWTVGAADHLPNVDVVLGAWGDLGSPDQRVLVSLLFKPAQNGGSFMVIDGTDRPANSPELCSRALLRTEVVGTPVSTQVFAIVDAIWLGEPRIAEVKALSDVA
jgi:hypothetical protein